MSAAFRKIRCRSAGTDCDHAGNAAAAAAIARSASARVPAGSECDHLAGERVAILERLVRRLPTRRR